MKTLIVLVCIGLLLPGLNALKCYECSASGDDKCNDPLNFVTAMTMKTCETSMGYCMKAKAGNVVTRSCAPICGEINTKDNGIFCCQKDKCNSGTRSSFNFTMLLALPIFALLIAVKRHF